MPVPLYTCGLAKVGHDEPFHELDVELRRKGAHEVHVSGGEVSEVLLRLTGGACSDRSPYAIPYECPHVVKSHLQECDSEPCDHDKTCLQLRLGWVSLEAQRSIPYACHLSDGMAQQLIDFYLADIDVLRHRVSQKLQSHGDAVLKRWRKMSKDKRGKFLSAVSPRVFGTWPVEIGYCPNDGCYEKHFHSWSHGAWLNLMDFSDDWMKLISVLHVRCVHGAASWAPHDSRACVISNWKDCLPLWFSDRCVFMCGDRFGQLTDHDSNAIHKNIIVGLPRALLIFQGQHELLCVLENILKDLTKGIAPSGSVQWSSFATKDLHSAGHEISWNSYIHQPFTAAVAYSAEHLYQKSTERLEMVKDELMLLQTDPAYAQEVIKMRRVALSNAAPGSRHAKQYEDVGGFLVTELLTRFEMWHTISSRCSELKKAMVHSNEVYTPGRTTPPEVAMHIYALEASIEHWRERSSEDFEELRHFTNLGPRQVPSSHSRDHMDTADVNEVLDPDNPIDRLKWQIAGIRQSAGRKGRHPAGHASLFVAIEREEATDRIMDQLTREYINDAMIMDEIYTHITWIQQILDPTIEFPWVKSGESCCILDDPKCRHSWLQFASGWQQRIGALAQSLMDAPWPKGRKDLAWLAKATLTRSRLGKLWQGIFAEYGKAQEAGRSSPCGTYFMTSTTEFANDPVHLAQLEAERGACELESHRQSLVAEENARALTGYIPQIQWGSDGAGHEKKLKSEKKAKLKAKPVQTAGELARAMGTIHLEYSPDDSARLNSDEPQTPHAKISIRMKRENLVVFQKMYRADTESNQGGTIRWQAFVQAMKDAGFTAEEAAGSAVSFRSSSLGGSICFHRPHPDPVLHPIMLYAMARRLTKWFGFTTDTFVLRETEADI